ncbi:MAG: hypothetical protein JNM84_01370 [Planctomycetes bacterium]|nr:hypothetical protein [Planctomycetota bacterium]
MSSTVFLRITRVPYEEPHHLELVVAASNGRQGGEIGIYCNAEELRRFARTLCEMSSQHGASAIWEIGSERAEERWAYHFRIRVSPVLETGLCVVELRFDDLREPPYRELTAFSIDAQPADVDRLAGLLERFANLRHRVLEWRVVDGELRDEVDSEAAWLP